MKVNVTKQMISAGNKQYAARTIVVIKDNSDVIFHHMDGLGSVIVQNGGQTLVNTHAGDDCAVADHAATMFERHAGITIQAALEHTHTAKLWPDTWYDRGLAAA